MAEQIEKAHVAEIKINQNMYEVISDKYHDKPYAPFEIIIRLKAHPKATMVDIIQAINDYNEYNSVWAFKPQTTEG